MKKIARFFHGFVFIELTGEFPERFFNICRSRQIPLYEVATIKNDDKIIYTAQLRISDYFRIKPIAKKSHCIPKIRKKIGMPFFLKRYKKRLAFFIGGMYCLWLMWLLSLFVWDISVTGGFVHTEQELLSYLKENHYVCGMRKESVDCTELERRLRLDYPDIGWVSAELKGTKLYIRIAETDMPMIQEENETPAHIVATADGRIEQLVCRTGTPLVKVGDVVKKGDILVRGVIDVIGDNDIKTKSYPVCADADVLIESIKKYSHSMERMYEEKKFTKKSKTGYDFFYGNKKIFSHMPSHSYTNYAIMTEDEVVSLHDHFPLPFRIKKTVISEYVPVKKQYSEDEAKGQAGQALERYISYLTECGITIRSVDCNTTVTEKEIVTSGKLVLVSAAWEQVAVQENEWREQITDEYSGDHNESSGGT